MSRLHLDVLFCLVKSEKIDIYLFTNHIDVPKKSLLNYKKYEFLIGSTINKNALSLCTKEALFSLFYGKKLHSQNRLMRFFEEMPIHYPLTLCWSYLKGYSYKIVGSH